MSICDKTKASKSTGYSKLSKILCICACVALIFVFVIILICAAIAVYRTAILQLTLHGIIFSWGLVNLLIVVVPVAIKFYRVKLLYNSEYNLNCMIMHLLYVSITMSVVETMIDMKMASKDYMQMLNQMSEGKNIYIGLLYTMLLLMLAAETYVDILYLYDVIRRNENDWYRSTVTYALSGIVISVILSFLSLVVDNPSNKSRIDTLVPICASMAGIVIFKYIDTVNTERLIR